MAPMVSKEPVGPSVRPSPGAVHRLGARIGATVGGVGAGVLLGSIWLGASISTGAAAVIDDGVAGLVASLPWAAGITAVLVGGGAIVGWLWAPAASAPGPWPSRVVLVLEVDLTAVLIGWLGASLLLGLAGVVDGLLRDGLSSLGTVSAYASDFLTAMLIGGVLLGLPGLGLAIVMAIAWVWLMRPGRAPADERLTRAGAA